MEVARPPISAEDRFALVDLSGPDDTLLPDLRVMENIVAAAYFARSRWTFLWDLRRLGSEVYGDTVDAFGGVFGDKVEVDEPPIMLVPPGRKADVQEAFRPRALHLIEMDMKDVRWSELPLSPFEYDLLGTPTVDYDFPVGAEQAFIAYADGEVDVKHALRTLVGERSWGNVCDELAEDQVFAHYARLDWLGAARIAERTFVLDAAFTSATTYSMLTQLAIEEHQGEIFVTPYHGSALHHVETGGEAVLVRPARVNRRYWATFHQSLLRLQALLNKPRLKEREIENLLISNPLLLGSLGYADLYHQVVLPRTGAADLRPDIIAEPVGAEWAEILELKLPSEPILVGRPDRAQLAAGLAQAVAQLREYSAYFDDRKAAETIEARIGLRCYKPKLTVIIGRDPRQFTPEQRRRALTAYPDLRVVTYDELIRAVQRRLLM